MTTFLLLLAAVLPLASSVQSPVAIYVFATPSDTGFTDANQQLRAQAVADLQHGLSKKKGLVVVNDRASADVQIEVLENTIKATGNMKSMSAGLLFGAFTKAERTPAVHVALRSGDYALEIEGRGKHARRAADAVTDHVAKWVTDNRELLERRRQLHTKVTGS